MFRFERFSQNDDTRETFWVDDSCSESHSYSCETVCDAQASIGDINFCNSDCFLSTTSPTLGDELFEEPNSSQVFKIMFLLVMIVFCVSSSLIAVQINRKLFEIRVLRAKVEKLKASFEDEVLSVSIEKDGQVSL